MAVVRFSSELTEAIIANAKDLFNKQISEATKRVPPIGAEVAAMVFAPYMPTVNALPRDFFRWTNRIEVRVPYGTNYVEATFELTTEYPKVDNRIKLDDGVLVTSMFCTNIKLPDAPQYKTYIDQLGAWTDSIKALEKQRDEFVAGVKKVINAHATLAPALKAWPPLWDLVPETFRERHRKVTERAKPAATAELDVDLTSLTAAVTIAKITR
jgi:hypothetical protein